MLPCCHCWEKRKRTYLGTGGKRSTLRSIDRDCSPADHQCGECDVLDDPEMKCARVTHDDDEAAADENDVVQKAGQTGYAAVGQPPVRRGR
jgi:hypothetical protein